MTAFQREPIGTTDQGIEILAILRELNQRRVSSTAIDDALNNISDTRECVLGLPDLLRMVGRRLEDHTEALRDNTAAMRLVLALLPAEQQEQMRVLQLEQRQAERSIAQWCATGD